MPPRLIGIVRVEVPAGIKRGRRQRPDNRDKAAECGAGVWNIMIWHLEIQFLYIGMNNSREKVVWANLLLIISDLYLLGYYCHGWLPLNEVTDKNTPSKGFVRLVHRLEVQPQLQDLRSHFVEFIMYSFLFFFYWTFKWIFVFHSWYLDDPFNCEAKEFLLMVPDGQRQTALYDKKKTLNMDQTSSKRKSTLKSAQSDSSPKCSGLTHYESGRVTRHSEKLEVKSTEDHLEDKSQDPETGLRLHFSDPKDKSIFSTVYTQNMQVFFSVPLKWMNSCNFNV